MRNGADSGENSIHSDYVKFFLMIFDGFDWRMRHWDTFTYTLDHDLMIFMVDE